MGWVPTASLWDLTWTNSQSNGSALRVTAPCANATPAAPARGCIGALAASPNCINVAGTEDSAETTSAHSPSCAPSLSPVSTAPWRRPIITALRVIILLNKRCKLSECEGVLLRALRWLPIAQCSCSPSIISGPRQVKWDDCHCGEVVKYKMLHLLMKWKCEQPERGTLQPVLPHNQPGRLCGASATGKFHRIP